MAHARRQSGNPVRDPPERHSEELPEDPTEIQSCGPEPSRQTPQEQAPAAPLDEFSPGMVIGRYRLLARIASGGMAHVWAAKPEGSGFARTIALKLVRNELAADEEYARMFIDEARLAAAVHHPNVCETYELGQDGNVLFMALEWIAGDTLAGILHQGQGTLPLPYPVACKIIADACAGLHAAHEALGHDGQPLNIVHRDISPPNILLSLQGRVKVTDFGIAKARYQLHAKTRTGEIKGKFAYIAPEQIVGKSVDRRADIYAMGCVLYVAALGLKPFGSGPRAMTKILRGDFEPPSQVSADFPKELEAIILKALASDPDARYSTAEQMRVELERWVASHGSIGHAEIGRVVRERLRPARKQSLDALLNTNKFSAEVLAEQISFQQDGLDHTATPTAGQHPALRSVSDAITPTGLPSSQSGVSVRNLSAMAPQPSARRREGDATRAPPAATPAVTEPEATGTLPQFRRPGGYGVAAAITIVLLTIALIAALTQH
jgi:serine/threonine-protein kinase